MQHTFPSLLTNSNQIRLLRATQNARNGARFSSFWPGGGAEVMAARPTASYETCLNAGGEAKRTAFGQRIAPSRLPFHAWDHGAGCGMVQAPSPLCRESDLARGTRRALVNQLTECHSDGCSCFRRHLAMSLIGRRDPNTMAWPCSQEANRLRAFGDYQSDAAFRATLPPAQSRASAGQ